jgi:hypothetical protein
MTSAPREGLRPEITAILDNFKPCSALAFVNAMRQLSDITFYPDDLTEALKAHVATKFNRIAQSGLSINETDLVVLLEHIGLPVRFQESAWNFEPIPDSIIDYGDIQEKSEQIKDYFCDKNLI